MYDVPVAGLGQASRTNHARLGSSRQGSARALCRSCQAERSQPVAPVPVPTRRPLDDCGSVASPTRSS